MEEFILFLPVLVLLLLANLAERERAWFWLIALFMVGVAGLVGLTGLILLAVGAGLMPPAVLEASGLALTADPWVALMGLVLGAAALLIVLLLVPPVRRLLVRPLGTEIDADRPIIITALFLSVGLLVVTITGLATIRSLPPDAFAELAVTQADLWVQGLIFAAAGVIGVGLGVRRGWRETLERLGLTAITRRQVAIVVGLAILLLLASTGMDMLWRLVDPASYERTTTITESMLGNLSGPVAALTIGLSAGIGEEILFRGALQPRFGLLFATLLFTAGHMQYEVTPALLAVFLIGLVLGVVRQRFNTTAAILLHALYNASLLLIPWVMELAGF